MSSRTGLSPKSKNDWGGGKKIPKRRIARGVTKSLFLGRERLQGKSLNVKGGGHKTK